MVMPQFTVWAQRMVMPQSTVWVQREAKRSGFHLVRFTPCQHFCHILTFQFNSLQKNRATIGSMKMLTFPMLKGSSVNCAFFRRSRLTTPSFSQNKQVL